MVAEREADRVRHPPVRQARNPFRDGFKWEPRPEAVDHAAALQTVLWNLFWFAQLLARRQTDRVRLAQERRRSDLHDERGRRWTEAGHSLAERGGGGQDRLVTGRLTHRLLQPGDRRPPRHLFERLHRAAGRERP